MDVLQKFLKQESAAGLLLIGSAVLALTMANSPLAASYSELLHLYAGGMTIAHWINDGLMVLFFLLVGLEIKREVLAGELSTWPQRVLPGIAAAGGMAIPALIYVAINAGNPDTLRGWAIPAATDIAFALGVLSLLGPRVPASLKVFLTALAIIDDLGAVAIIAVFFTGELSWPYLALAALALVALSLMNVLRVTNLAPYLLIGIALWVFVLRSGVHATLAGVALAMAIPMRSDRGESPLEKLEHTLSPMVAFLVLPIFGLANAGVSATGFSASSFLNPIPLGAMLGLFLGKQIGVFGASWAAIRFFGTSLPAHATWTQLYAVSILTGIGFTMSLFIGALAFGDTDLTEQAKLGVLAGSALSAIAGWLVLRLTPTASPPSP